MIKVKNKVIFPLAIAFMVLFSFQNDTFAAETYKVETNYLNVRSEANPFSEINTTIKLSEEVLKIKEYLYAGSIWYYIKTDSGIYGWVNSDYLEDKFDANDTTNQYELKLTSIADYLNIREDPNEKVLEIVSKEEVLTFKDKIKEFNGFDWYLVELNGTTGWVKSNLVKEHSRSLKELLRPNGEPYEPNNIYYDDFAVPYKNGGKTSGLNLIQSGIYASTWGGEPVFDGEDKKNTHFIGSSELFSNLTASKKITITDNEGVPYQYIINKIYNVDARGIGEDGENYWDRITGEDGGERIVIQTSVGNDLKMIVEAFFSNKIK